MATALALWCALLAALIYRRERFGGLTIGVVGAGSLLIALAAAGPEWNRPTTRWAAVMVDVSPSTRTAGYRDAEGLARRIHELLGETPYRVTYFADGPVEAAPASGGRITDLPCERTVYPVPSGAAAVLLFSDCRFELPAQSAPVYVVDDVGLEDVGDAAVSSLEVRGGEARVGTSNGGAARGMTLHGLGGTIAATAPSGPGVVSRRVAPGANVISAELAPGDAWPENDALSAVAPPGEVRERWWVSGSVAAPAGWRAVTPGQLPTEAAAYLAASVVALANVSAADLSEGQTRGLAQYVRDAGGALMILGGDRAFGAGGYMGTRLEALSPLASSPPRPTTHWVILADSSGSMSASADAGGGDGGATRWAYAARAVAGVLPHLPPDDVVSVGSFAEGVNWWAESRPVREVAAAAALPPAGVEPHGPTNLQAALEAVARGRSAMPVELLVLSDLDARVDDADALAGLLRAGHVKLHVLAVGDGSGSGAVGKVARDTAGSVVTQLDPARWAASVREMLSASVPDGVRRDGVRVTFREAAAPAAGQEARPWNRVWMKAGATKLADANDGGETVPLAGSWNVGEGRVLAAAFGPGTAQLEMLTKGAEGNPRDPRFGVSWESGARVHVTVEAAEGNRYLNDLPVTVELVDVSHDGAGKADVRALEQTAPGRYEATFAAPRTPRLGVVRVDGKAVERAAVAGRYAPEFEAVGNDHAAMEELARRSGGRVVGPAEGKRLDIRWPAERVPLTSGVAFLGAAAVLGALFAMRKRVG